MAIGDEIFDFMAKLKGAGFAAFEPAEEFLETFAGNNEELQIHRRCVIETAKELLAQPWPMRLKNEESKWLYRSSFLEQLREQRDQINGVPLAELRSQFSGGEVAWRSEIDPCRRRLIQSQINDWNTYQNQLTALRERQRQLFEAEVQFHSTGLGKLPHTFDFKGRYKFFMAVMERDATLLKFYYDDQKSRQNYPVFSKLITRNWDLCWAIEEPRGFLDSLLQGQFDPYLELRHGDLCGQMSKAGSGEVLHIRLSRALPGFFNAYWIFYNLDELETVIKAHLYLYSLMGSIIENGIRNTLKTGFD